MTVVVNDVGRPGRGPQALVALLKTISPIDDDLEPVVELPIDPIEL